MTTPVKDAATFTDLSGLAALKRGATTSSDPQTLREVARQFESVFAKMMLTSMRQASSSVGDSLFGSDQTEFYQGMFDDQLSLELTKGKGLGLADMLVRQLQKVTGVTPGADAAKEGAGLQTAERGSDSLDVATRFVHKMLSGNAAANAAGVSAAGTANTFRTPTSPEDFVQQLWPCAEAAGRELGIAPAHLLAQAALETGWGKSLPCDANGNPSFNFFGIKAGADWTGGTVATRTLEFQGGIPTAQVARFRAYDSAEDSFRDYVALLRDNPRYAAALNTGNDAQAFATALQRGGYASDPAYARKIAAIAQNLGGKAPQAIFPK
jgi:flagellar protein FlgJ